MRRGYQSPQQPSTKRAASPFAPFCTPDPDAPWKSAAVGRYGNGDTIRTDAFRYTEYAGAKGKPTSRMLYDHVDDPHENVNIAAASKDVVLNLADQLHATMGATATDTSPPYPSC